MSSMKLLSAGALCRLDDVLAERIRRGDDLRGIALSSSFTVLVGSAAYGIALGVWRAPEQAVYSALKLPLLFFAIVGTSAGAGAMLASVLRAKLSLRQTSACILIGFAVTSSVLGALSPIALLVQAVVPPPDPSVAGLAVGDPRLEPSLAVAWAQVLLHVVVVACAGMTGVVRLRGLLGRLGLSAALARRVLVAWMAVELLAGAQLSWLLRPFLGKPHLQPSFSCDDLLSGNFFEEVAISARGAFGEAAVPALWAIGLGLAAALARSLFVEPRTTATIEVDELGLRINAGERMVDMRRIARVSVAGASVRVALVPDEALVSEVLVVPTRDEHAAGELRDRIDRERTRMCGGPFRISPAPR